MFVRETAEEARVRKAALTKQLVMEYVTLSNQLCSQLKQAQSAFKIIPDTGTASAAKAVAASLDLKLLWAMGALPLTENNKRLLRKTMPEGMVPLNAQAPTRRGVGTTPPGRPYVHSTHPSRRPGGAAK